MLRKSGVALGVRAQPVNQAFTGWGSGNSSYNHYYRQGLPICGAIGARLLSCLLQKTTDGPHSCKRCKAIAPSALEQFESRLAELKADQPQEGGVAQ